ncbi:MAG TPA: glycosyltransferase [Polyangiaceae bacterium]|nr:glycosyltransferase [Polyangiaceae bacterium]
MFVLAPLHHQLHLDNLLKQFRDQDLPTKRLIIVSDGFKKPLQDIPPGVVYSHQETKRGVGAARNECVRIARELNPNERAAFLDCDDKYRRLYLSKVRKALREYVGCGQGEFWQRNLLDKEEVLIGEGSANQVSERGMAGGTLGFHLKYCVPFSETLQTGEDTAWCRDMREALLAEELQRELEQQGLKAALWSMSNYYYTKVNRGPNAGHTHP